MFLSTKIFVRTMHEIFTRTYCGNVSLEICQNSTRRSRANIIFFRLMYSNMYIYVCKRIARWRSLSFSHPFSTIFLPPFFSPPLSFPLSPLVLLPLSFFPLSFYLQSCFLFLYPIHFPLLFLIRRKFLTIVKLKLIQILL